MDVVVERAVDRATASSASCPRSIPSRSRASRDALARFAISATPAASIPCAATNSNATRNPSNPTRKLPGGTRANATRSAPISNPASNNAANRSQRDAHHRGVRRRVDPDFIARGAERSKTRQRVDVLAGRVASDEIGRDATKSTRRGHGRELNAAFSFSRVSAAPQRGGVARPRGSTRPRAVDGDTRSRSSDASRDARKPRGAERR